MMKHIAYLFLFLCLGFCLRAQSSEMKPPVKQTYIYSIKGKDTLRLDKYEGQINIGEPKPCMIFLFGGGFYTGQRDGDYYIPYFEFLTQNGFTVISIDYRLGFATLTDDGKTGLRGFVKLLKNTIDMAVEDLFDATNFVLARAEEWNLNKAEIVASGSSAGAITVLQGAYEISTASRIAAVLPPGFNYAGIISFAGAIFSNKGNLKWGNNTAPIQLFHGDADRNVPYNKIKFCKLGFFGSKNIAKRLDKYNLPYYFYTARYTDHKLAATPMYDNREEILIFLNQYVFGQKARQTNVSVFPLDQPAVKTNFSIFDYIRANIPQN